MSWTHVPDALLARFVDGELETLDAVKVAVHLDGCPACAARAAAAEPLGQAFASIDDPVPPPDLAPAIVAAALDPGAGLATRTPAVAAGLVAAGALIMVGLGAPAELWGGLQALAAAVGSVARTVDLPVGWITPIWATAAMFTFAAAAMTARRLEHGTSAWR